MPTPPIGTAPHPRNTTTREQQTIDTLYRAADVTTDDDARPAMRAGLELIVTLIETRNRRMENGYFADRPHDED